ncbi:unnamed protein product [Medioppia subpectinata]|uniref:Cytosolic endo-beta-N-acetylglucosaminidase TIM barrel domain-containing protein n=1 Tax=Medioppia subpectinata TaxID=1979941 RepID=A0A7R9PT88_9ACAR|nr:unnamed protein product [Medioppia subpectinata]CAG2100397.1 unnamed protein product [Medioppia subpectinata]
MAQTYQVLCSPESKPLLTLEELLEWDCSDICRSDQSMSYSICELQTHKTHAKSGSKTLLCHDMKGGYLDDRFNSGCANETAYRFFLWSSIDVFVYFSLVIWYDSVISPGGELKWQNELNCNNWCFFDACDAIFLNYTWNETNLKTSYERAHQMRRNYDVFVGIDVFGRNCFGGGGLHTNLAVREALKHELSIALFASAWTHEVLGYENFTNNEYLFWSLLDLGVHHFPQTFPIYTSFCQELQPTNHKSVEVYIEEAFNGGGCLRLTDTLVHLFECEIMVEKKCFYAITYKSISNHKLNTIFKYQNENNENENKALILFDNESENKDFFIQYIE